VGSERIPTLLHVQIEPKSKVKEGETDILACFARVMADAGQFGKPAVLTDLIDKVSELVGRGQS
jgi:hypothetical protein